MLSSLLAKFKPESAQLKTQNSVNLIKQTALQGEYQAALNLLRNNKHLPAANASQLQGAIYDLIGEIQLAKEHYKQAVVTDNTQPLWVKRAAGKPVYSMIHLPEWKMAYFPMPKCASSSIKSLLVKIESDQDLVFAHPCYENPYKSTQAYTELDLQKDYCFVVIRDPIERFLSYYQKNIIEEDSLVKESKNLGFDSGLNNKPNLNEFVEQLEHYIFAFDDVRHHTLPQYAYLADVLDNIQDYYVLHDLPKLHKKLNDWMGKPLLLSHLMESKKKIVADTQSLSRDMLNKLTLFYADDMALLKKVQT